VSWSLSGTWISSTNTNVRIAGRKTIADWQQSRQTLAVGADTGPWQKAFNAYFVARLTSRYLKPIELLHTAGTFDGEGFSILAIHCSLIEFLESTLQGLSYRHVRRGDPPLTQYEYSKSGEVFANFLSTRRPFCTIFDNALAADFYANVRCALLHEARTKDGWIVKAKGPAIVAVSSSEKIVYRNNFHRALIEFLDWYRAALLTDPQLQEAFIRKFDGLCQ
jgi:hypothetical protein